MRSEIKTELIHQFIWFWDFLPNRKATVDSPVITSVASTVQLFQSDQSQVIWGQMGNTIRGGWAEVDPVKPTPTNIRNGLVAVGFCVPRVTTVLLFAKFLPHITDVWGKTHFGHLLWSSHWNQQYIERLQYFKG